MYMLANFFSVISFPHMRVSYIMTSMYTASSYKEKENRSIDWLKKRKDIISKNYKNDIKEHSIVNLVEK